MKPEASLTALSLDWAFSKEVNRARDTETVEAHPGSLCYMTPERVQPLEAGFRQVMMSFKKLGAGSVGLVGR